MPYKPIFTRIAKHKSQKWRSPWERNNGFQILILSILGSVLFHGLLLAILYLSVHSIPSIFWKEDQMVLRLSVSGKQKGAPATTETLSTPFEHRPYAEKQSTEVTPPEHKLKEVSVETAAPDEGYLPQELLSRAAIPEGEIDFQDIPPPGTGSFRMQIWINSRGTVTQVDLDESDIPTWFTDLVIDKFKQSRFKPGMRDEKTVASIMRVEVYF